MINKDEVVNDLITKLLVKFKAEGYNISRKVSPFMLLKTSLS